MGSRIHRQVELAPNAVFLFAVLTNFPFAFAIDLEAGGSNDQVSHRASIR